MAKKSLIARDQKRQKLIQKHKAKRTFLKNELSYANSFEEKSKINLQLQKLPLNSSPCRFHHRCWITGRPKAYYRVFGLSRHALRELAHQGFLPGLRKASW